MARPKNSVPSYAHHKPTGQAYIRIRDDSGRRKIVYLGAYASPESREAYAAEIAKLDRPRIMPPADGSPLSLNEVLLAFLQHAIQHYRRPDGTATRELGEFKQVAGFLRRIFGESPAAEFGPRKLKDVREQFLAAGWCRKVINLRINRVRHIFKWAAGEELVPGAVWQDLRAVEGLQAGRTIAPERPPVGPVDEAAVKRVLPHLRPMVRAMVEVQLLTGMRPGEVIGLRPVELDTTAAVWVYRPSYHKLSYRAKARAVASAWPLRLRATEEGQHIRKQLAIASALRRTRCPWAKRMSIGASPITSASITATGTNAGAAFGSAVTLGNFGSPEVEEVS
ncbi:MAG: hypothetical protein U0791_16950 [Gemmataceae bacterium]